MAQGGEEVRRRVRVAGFVVAETADAFADCLACRSASGEEALLVLEVRQDMPFDELFG